MTAGVPSYIESTQASASLTLPASGTLAAAGAQAGDLCVIVQEGTSSGSGTFVSPSCSAGSNPFTGHPSNPQTAGTNNGRAAMFHGVLDATNITGSITLSNSTWTVYRATVYIIPGVWSATAASRLFASFGSTANTGSTPFTYSDPSRAACMLWGVGLFSGVNALTATYDGATSGTLFQRAPFADESSSTTSTPGHSNHYGTSDNRCQSDYQEYAAGDTASSFLCNNGMGNTTHAIIGAVFQVNAGGQLTTASEVETAQPITILKAKAVATASEVESAQTITKAQGAHIANTASEVDTAQAIVAVKKKAIGTASEVDSALSVRARAFPLTTVTEADTAQTLLPLKSYKRSVPVRDLGPQEWITSFDATVSKNYPVDTGEVQLRLLQNGVLVDQSAWTTITDTPTLLSMTLGTQVTGTTFTIEWEWRTYGSLDFVITDVGADTVFHVATATETDEARTITHLPRIAVFAAPEVDTAVALSRLKIFRLGTAAETDTAGTINAVATTPSTPQVGTLRISSQGTFDQDKSGTFNQKTFATLEPE